MDNFLKVASKIREKKNDKKTIKILEQLISKLDNDSEHDNIISLMSIFLQEECGLDESCGIIGIESYNFDNLLKDDNNLEESGGIDDKFEVRLQLNFDKTDEKIYLWVENNEIKISLPLEVL